MMRLYRVTKTSTTLEAINVEAESEAAAVQLAATMQGTLVGQASLYSAAPLAPAPAPVRMPVGFGTYFRRITDSAAEAEAAAARCKAAGMAWATLMVEATDGFTVSAAARKTYAEALRASGIEVGVWTFPGDARAASVEQSRAAGLALTEAAADIGALLLMLDVEQPYKGQHAELDALITTTLASAPAGASVGVVSYPVPSYHPSLDWATFAACAWGSPMFYQSAASEALVSKGMAEWQKYVPVLAPSLDGWEGSGAAGAARLAGDIERVCGPAPARVPSAVVWSEGQMDDAKRAVTKAAGSRYGWPQP